MGIINHKLVSSGALTLSKSAMYPFVPSRIPTNAIDWSSGNKLILESGKIAKKANFDFNGYVFNQKLILKKGENELILDEVAISINLTHNIVTTEVVGMQGTVKEYVCAGDYYITITCAIVAVDDEGNIIDDYPEKALDTLVFDYLYSTESLEVYSDLFDILNIRKMVVTSVSIEPNEQSNRQVVEIRGLSDGEYTIEN